MLRKKKINLTEFFKDIKNIEPVELEKIGDYNLEFKSDENNSILDKLDLGNGENIYLIYRYIYRNNTHWFMLEVAKRENGLFVLLSHDKVLLFNNETNYIEWYEDGKPWNPEEE